MRSVSGEGEDGRRVVAVIANRDRRESLLRCLRHLAQLDERCSDIVVADDASVDDSVTATRTEFPGAHVVYAPAPLGPAGVRNLGVDHARRHCRFEYLLFLDNDAFLEPAALTKMLDAAAADAGIGIVTPKAYQSLHERRLHLAGELKVNFYTGTVRDVGAGELDVGQYDIPRRIRGCSGFTMLVRREALDRVDGFDNAFAGAAWEDVDFCLRVQRAGFELAYAPDAVVEHPGGVRGRGRLHDREVAKARNWFLLMRRHATPLQWLCFLALLPLRSAQLAVRRIADGETWAIPAQLGGAAAVLRDLREAVRRRR